MIIREKNIYRYHSKFENFIRGLMCFIGIHHDYQHDCEWVGRCAYCDYKNEIETGKKVDK